MQTTTKPLSPARASETAAAIRFLDHLFAGHPPERVSFRFWDGTTWPDNTPQPATLVVKHPGSLRAMFGPGTETAMAEAYVRDQFDVEGDLEAACGLADALEDRPTGWLHRLADFQHLRLLPTATRTEAAPRFDGHGARLHSVERDRAAVSFHYDVSNDFYGLWLDRQMLYSCAYFSAPDIGLDAAQEAKLRHLCRKLRLQPGDRILDIGCGWGGLALHAAREHGVDVTGITLSARQAELATARARDAGLADAVHIELRDYRELRVPAAFDAIVSVGMAEHLGVGQLPRYFRAASDLLKAGGVMLNHAIGQGTRQRGHRGPSFIDKHVFPDSHIPPIPEVLQAAEASGFEVRDVENLREHYVLTLRHWVRRLEAAHEAARSHVSEETYRTWRLYMAGCARGFARGHLAIYQTLLAKPDSQGRSHLPLTRADWYADHR